MPLTLLLVESNWAVEVVEAEDVLLVESVVPLPACCAWISMACIWLPNCWKALVRSLVDSELALLLPELLLLLSRALNRSLAWPLLTPGGAPATNSVWETWPSPLVSSLLKNLFSWVVVAEL